MNTGEYICYDVAPCIIHPQGIANVLLSPFSLPEKKLNQVVDSLRKELFRGLQLSRMSEPCSVKMLNTCINLTPRTAASIPNGYSSAKGGILVLEVGEESFQVSLHGQLKDKKKWVSF